MLDNMIRHADVQQYSHLELLARQVVEGFITGLHKSPFHGFSVEFAEHRLYNTGEPTRHIDWKLFGKTEKLFVKRYEEETNLRCQLVIDNSSSMYFPDPKEEKGVQSKINFSVHAAAAMIYLLRKQRDAVGLSVFSEDVELQTQAKSSAVHHKFLFYELEKMLSAEAQEKPRKTFAASALHNIAEFVHKRSLVMIFSDMFDNTPGRMDELFSALQHLRHNKHEVVLFHVVDKKKEVDFDFENRPYLFVDVETGQEVKAHTNEVKAAYLKSMAEFDKEIRLRCAQYRIEYVEADVRQGYEQVLLPYLIKREKMA